jgi:membrane-bound metal-dependent hydrolase YbcI (DUF457 family)
MAGFKTHITTSTILGIGYGAAGHLAYGVPLETATLAAGLCSLSGMLPDLDSDSGVPLRESMAFAAAVVPMLMLDRFQQLKLPVESIVLAGGLIYLIIRFGLAALLKRYTVHRGMWHSVPAAVIAGLLAFLICSCQSFELRLFKTSAVVIGYVSHLLLDELYSIEWYRGRLRRKRSFGTALKLWSNSWWANISTYGKLVLLLVLVTGDPVMMKYCTDPDCHVHHTASKVHDHLWEAGSKLLKR